MPQVRTLTFYILDKNKDSVVRRNIRKDGFPDDGVMGELPGAGEYTLIVYARVGREIIGQKHVVIFENEGSTTLPSAEIDRIEIGDARDADNRKVKSIAVQVRQWGKFWGKLDLEIDSMDGDGARYTSATTVGQIQGQSAGTALNTYRFHLYPESARDLKVLTCNIRYSDKHGGSLIVEEKREIEGGGNGAGAGRKAGTLPLKCHTVTFYKDSR